MNCKSCGNVPRNNAAFCDKCGKILKPKKKYVFKWKDGLVEHGIGASVSEAFSSLGYSAGALAVLDSYGVE